MKVIVKYKVLKSFIDKNSKKTTKKGETIEISVERMKELNKKFVGRAEDIIIQDEENIITSDENNISNENNQELQDLKGNNNSKFPKEELEKMSVNELKELAEKNSIELTKAKKQEIIDEIISKE